MIEVTIKLTIRRKVIIPIINFSFTLKERYSFKKEGRDINDFFFYSFKESHKKMCSFLTENIKYHTKYDKDNNRWISEVELELIDENMKGRFFQRLREDGWRKV
jgi:hypothetical protein